MIGSTEDIYVELLHELITEVRGLRGDIRRSRAPEDTSRFVEALDEFFGTVGTFRVKGLFDIANENPHCEIANAIGELIDLNSPERSRTTKLGKLLSRIPEIEKMPCEIEGSASYRLRTSMD